MKHSACGTVPQAFFRESHENETVSAECIDKSRPPRAFSIYFGTLSTESTTTP